MHNDPILSDPTEHHKPIKPTQEVYGNSYGTNPHYGQVSLPPPGRKHRGLTIVIAGIVLTPPILAVLGAMLLLIQPQLVYALLTHQPWPQVLSKTPLLEQGQIGGTNDYSCNVVTKDDPSVQVVLWNPNSNTVYQDCKTFMEQVQD